MGQIVKNCPKGANLKRNVEDLKPSPESVFITSAKNGTASQTISFRGGTDRERDQNQEQGLMKIIFVVLNRENAKKGN